MRKACKSLLLVGMAAMLASIAGAAKAEDEPAYVKTVGRWEIASFAKPNGSLISCRMTTKTEKGPSFSYRTVATLGNGNFTAKAMFIYPAAAEEMPSITAVATFDGKDRIHLKAGIASGYVHAELPSDHGALQRILNSLRRSRVLKIVTGSGQGAAVLHVKLDDSAAAFAANGVCMLEIVEKTMDQMIAAPQ